VIPGRPVTLADAPAIQALIDSDPETYALLEGEPVRADEAEQLLREVTPGKRRFTHLLDELALIDLLEGYPDAALRLRDAIAGRVSRTTGEFAKVRAVLAGVPGRK